MNIKSSKKGVLILIEDSLRNLTDEGKVLSIHQIETLIEIFILLLTLPELSLEDARSCNRILREAGFNTIIPLGDISKEYE